MTHRCDQQATGAPVLLFWDDVPVVQHQVGPSCLSQWHPSPFTDDGLTYATAEHYMMAAKARLFDDQETAERIIASDHPGQAASLGRQVRHFDEQLWAAQRRAIVFQGNLLKFSQQPGLRDYLLGTGEAVLALASPWDAIWGIGLDEYDDRARDPRRWPGLNLLGLVLMDVRAALH